MKIKTTAKAIRQSGRKVIQLGYCECQRLLNKYSPLMYSSGVYGWNFDVYLIDNVYICTGYRGMPGQTLPYKEVDRLEKLAYNASNEGKEVLIKELISLAK